MDCVLSLDLIDVVSLLAARERTARRTLPGDAPPGGPGDRVTCGGVHGVPTLLPGRELTGQDATARAARRQEAQ